MFPFLTGAPNVPADNHPPRVCGGPKKSQTPGSLSASAPARFLMPLGRSPASIALRARPSPLTRKPGNQRNSRPRLLFPYWHRASAR